MLITRIKNLRLRAIIGAYDIERNVKQNVILNISYAFDASKAQLSDNLEDTIDYQELVKVIAERVEESRFYLVERLADYIATLVMENKRIVWVKVRVEKPDALRVADSAGVEVYKERK